MAEWSNAAVLKTVDCNRSGGSNPSLSAFARRSFNEGGLFYEVVSSFLSFPVRATADNVRFSLNLYLYFSAMWYYVYILELNNKKHYVGCTINMEERLSRHLKGYVPSTKPYRPLKLVWCCSFTDRYKAYQFEK